MGRKRAAPRRIIFLLMLAVLVLLPAASAEATFPGANGKIAFASNSSGNDEIYTVNPDGTGRTNLTNSPEQENYPAWSADGKRIAYVSGSEVGADCGYLWTMNADGSGKTQLGPPRVGWEPAWSPDGLKIAAGACGDEFYTINSDGSGYQWIFFRDGGEGRFGIDWSPDGQRIALGSGKPGTASIWTIRPDGSNLTDISPDPLHNDFSGFPSWSPDGEKIAYYWLSYTNNDQWIATVNPDGTGNAVITGTDFVEGVAWSPDKSKIVYAEGGALFKINADGSGVRVAVPGVTFASRPDWQALRPPGYARPTTATPTSIRLVPAYQPCSSANSTHGAPLAVSSCNPPQQASDYLTVGIPDAVGNGKAANFTGYLTAKVMTESPIDLTNGDQSDVAFTVSITDVRDKQTLADYTGELRASFTLRLTDRLNGPGGVHPGTAADTSFGFAFSCTPTAGDIGSTCSASTSADAVMPGITPEAKRAIWQLGPLEVYDGGSDGDGDTTGDNTLFAVQGLFAP